MQQKLNQVLNIYCCITSIRAPKSKGNLQGTKFNPSFYRSNRVFSHDVTAANFVSQNNETAAMLVSKTSPV